MITNPQEYFYVKDGSVLKNIDDFLEKMSNISEETFNFHVNEERNDFATWTKVVLKDGILANRLKRAKSPEEIISSIQKRISSKEKMQRKVQAKKSMVKKIIEVHNAAS